MPDTTVRDIGALLEQANALEVDFNSMGTTGLRQSGGRIFEDPDPELRGTAQACRLYKEMVETDATVGGLMFVISNTVRNVQWKVARASDAPNDRQAAEFVDSCMRDMDTPWSSFIQEAITSIPYGFSAHEVLWKRRAGRHSAPWMNSRYADGRLGLRGLPIRGQDTIWEWIFDESGHVHGCVQYAWNVPRAVIEGDKFLLFTQGGHKGNPEGLGLCRRLVAPYLKKKNIEQIEQIGIERDLAGLPFASIDVSILQAAMGTGPEAEAARKTYQSIKNTVTRVKRDKSEGVIFPSQWEDGKQLFDFKLLNSGGARNFNINETVLRLTQEMYRSVQLDLMVLAQMGSSGGSFNLIADKRSMFCQAINGFLGTISETLNRQLIPMLMRVNGFSVSDYPAIEHESIDDTDIQKVAQVVQILTMSGCPIFPNQAVEGWFFEMLGLPKPTHPDAADELAAKIPAATAMPTGRLREIPNDDMAAAGYNQPMDTVLPRTQGIAEDAGNGHDRPKAP